MRKVQACRTGEISSVELIAELIEIELQEICFDIVIRVKDTPLCIAYGYVYPMEVPCRPWSCPSSHMLYT